ncbi:cysteine rich repeat-containing protein [Kaistia terrae]|uniref:Cysteine rich repeat-containing protein n=1 Tax=Kaistia terrae TaxID=537017 RepID=A0ABW0PYQ2_9HYPH|nr:cysteine rich repeat-containing protein [Kaistia terrae]MCX5579162.1 cysteine rich repeat-containing protein [Kaistia terrae]
MARPISRFLQVFASAAFAVILGFGLLPVMAQTPSKAQQSAIRSACPTDYRTYCASVPPGGMPALNCLQQNVAKLSDACRTAVQAVGGSAAAPATQPADATAPAGDATKPAAKTTGAAPATKAPAAAAKTPPAAAAATPPAVNLAPRQEAALIRQSCSRDFRTHCRGVPIGGGNVIACLKANAASLSPRCQSALAPFAQ